MHLTNRSFENAGLRNVELDVVGGGGAVVGDFRTGKQYTLLNDRSNYTDKMIKLLNFRKM